MAELRDAGALGFTDDGKPVVTAPAMLRKALQYQRLVRRRASRCTRRTRRCRGDGVMHEGEVSALLGLAGIPSISESTMVARDAALAGYEDGRDPHPAPVSARESVEAVARGQGRAACRSPARPSPHHLTAHRRGACASARHAR